MLKNLLSISHWRTTSDSHNIPDNQSENNRNFELYAGVASDGKIAHLCWLRRNIRPAVGMAVVLATGMIFSFGGIRFSNIRRRGSRQAIFGIHFGLPNT